GALRGRVPIVDCGESAAAPRIPPRQRDGGRDRGMGNCEAARSVTRGINTVQTQAVMAPGASSSMVQFAFPGFLHIMVVEVALARLWSIPDGTTCLLFKDPSADNWQLRVVRGTENLRVERFGNPIIAMDEAKRWRAAYDRSAAEAAS